MFVSLDLETTGFDPVKDKIIEFGAIKFDLQNNTDTLQFFINPRIPIPQIVTHITNISDADLKDAPSIEDKLAEIEAFIGDLPIIGHNISFDTAFLRANGINLKNPEYDTQELARTLMPDCPSHSLEVLSKELNLKHEEKHRALDDSIAAMELFLALAKKFQELPAPLFEKLVALSQKSDWPQKDFLKTLKNTPQPLKKTPLQQTTAQKLSNFQKILDSKTPTIHEEPAPFEELSKDLIATTPSNTYIAVPHDLFHKIHNEIPDTVAKIDTPERYISRARLAQFEQQSHFSNLEIISLFKYLIWIEQTQTGLLDEVQLHREEHSTIDKVCIDSEISDPAVEEFYKKALERDKNRPALCTHRYIFENPPPADSDLIIIDFENFIESFYKKSSIYLSLDYLSNILESLPKIAATESLVSKLTILFGIIGLIFEKGNDRSEYTPRSTINEGTLNTKEWLDAKNSVTNLIEISHELGEIKTAETTATLKRWKQALKDLAAVFLTTDPLKNFIWMEQNQRGEIVARQIPFSIPLNTTLKNYKNYQLVTENADLFEQSTFKNEILGLPTELAITKAPSGTTHIEVLIAKDINESDKGQIPNFFIRTLKNPPHNTAIILNSRLQLEYFTLKLSQNNIPLVSQLTASSGKLHAKFHENSDPKTVLTTPNVWFDLDFHEDIDTVYILKIPFDPPSDPFLLALSHSYEDAFNQLQIPLAAIAIKKIIKSMSRPTNHNKRVVILDPRLLNRSYGVRIVKKIEEICTVGTIKLDSLGSTSS